jgi:hypothetical protein
MKEKSKRLICNITIFLIIALAIAIVVIPKAIGNLDELWNFNFANNVENGLVPYKDFNMVQTPLLPMINAIFLAIFGNELIVMRILACLLCAEILFTFYKILNLLKANKGISLFAVVVAFYLLKDYFCMDYNFAVLLVTLIIIYIILKKKASSKKMDLLLGILAGICIMLKQSTGAIVAIALLGYEILLIKSKEEFIQYIKSTGIKLLGILIPVAIIFIYLAINGAVADFWDYCIAGIKTFTNKISYANLLNNSKTYIKVLSIITPIILIVTFLYSAIKNNKTLLAITSLSIASFSAVYPIADEVHFLIGVLPTCIIMFYLAELAIKEIVKAIIKVREKNLQTKESNIDKFFDKWLEYFLIFMTVGITAIYGYLAIPSIKDYLQNCKNDVNHFANVVITDYTYNKIQVMGEFISSQEKPVYILDAEAALYQIPLDIYYKDYDMFLIGNLGSKDEQGQIEKLEKDTNKIVIIKSDGVALNWQNPNKVREYVKQNMEYKDSILYFDIYE